VEPELTNSGGSDHREECLVHLAYYSYLGYAQVSLGLGEFCGSL